MKKILTASLVAMMAVSAANADIASTQYVTDRTGNVADSTYVKTLTNKTLAGAVDQLSADIKAVQAGGVADKSITTQQLADGIVESLNKANTALQAEAFETFKTTNTAAIDAAAAKGQQGITDAAAAKAVADAALPEADFEEFKTTNTAAIEGAAAKGDKGIADAAAAKAIADANKLAIENAETGLVATKAIADAAQATANAALPEADFEEFKTTNTAAIDAAAAKGDKGIADAAAAKAVADAAVARNQVGMAENFAVTDECKAEGAVCSLVVRAGVASWEKVVNE